MFCCMVMTCLTLNQNYHFSCGSFLFPCLLFPFYKQSRSICSVPSQLLATDFSPIGTYLSAPTDNN